MKTSRRSQVKALIASESLRKYLVIGAFAFLSDYLTLLLLFNVFHVPLKIATTCGYLFGFMVSFYSNRQWVFKAEGKKPHLAKQLTQYSILVVCNYIFTLQAVSYLNQQGIKPYIGKVLIMGMIICWNYALFRFVIFKTYKNEAVA